MYKKTKKFRLNFNKKSHKNNHLNQNGGGIFDFFTGNPSPEPVKATEVPYNNTNIPTAKAEIINADKYSLPNNESKPGFFSNLFRGNQNKSFSDPVKPYNDSLPNNRNSEKTKFVYDIVDTNTTQTPVKEAEVAPINQNDSNTNIGEGLREAEVVEERPVVAGETLAVARPVLEGEGTLTAEPVESNTRNFLSNNQQYTDNNVLNRINDKRKSNTSTDTLFTASTILTATKAALPALALTGVGAPAATALGALVVLIDKMVNLYRNNILLYIAMTDALSIISKSYLLYELILKSYDIISSKRLFYTVNVPGYQEQQITPVIDDFQNSRLKAKLDELIVLLFGIMRTKDIASLMTDQQLKNSPLGALLIKEDKRRREGVQFFSKLNRSLLKKFSAEWYVNEFTKTLTYISGILFNMYALNRSHVERIKNESLQNKETYEKEENNSQERINFDNPNLKRTTEAATQTVMEGNVQVLTQGVDQASQIQRAEEEQINNSDGNPREAAGGSFRKRKTRKLLRNFMLKKRV
jgi:hypothetical protein